MTERRFEGFPDRLAYLPVPIQLLGPLLRDIDSLAELKATLHCWRLIHQQKGGRRFVQRSWLCADRALLEALGEAQRSPEKLIEDALERAVSRGTFVALDVAGQVEPDRCYFLNSPANRRLIGQVLAGEIELEGIQAIAPPLPVEGRPRPNIFQLYEQNIGLLTPLIGEELQEAQQTYPELWIEEAFREAVARNRRSWRYIRVILERWSTEGRGHGGKDRRHPQPADDPRRYYEGPYGHLLKR